MLHSLEHLVVSKELLHLKAKDNSTLDKEDLGCIWNDWKEENYGLLVNQLGYKTSKGQFSTEFVMRHPFQKKLYPSCRQCSWVMLVI